MNNQLTDKRALILGGGGGIGFAIAKEFIASGAQVLIAGRTQRSLQEACDRLGGGADWMQWDIRDPYAAPDKVEEAAAKLGGLDIVVNCSGVLTDHDFADAFFDITPEEWDYVLEINLRGIYFVCQAVAKYMIAHEIRGHILNIASEMSFVPNVNAYGISKWGVRCLTEGLGVILGPKGITVNGIAPGPVATSMMRWKEGDSIANPSHPNGRMALPHEIGRLAVFLAGEAGENIVGQCILSDGGHSLAGLKKLVH